MNGGRGDLNKKVGGGGGGGGTGGILIRKREVRQKSGKLTKAGGRLFDTGEYLTLF